MAIQRTSGFPCHWWTDYIDVGFDNLGFLAYLWGTERRRIEGIYRLPLGYITEDSKLPASNIRKRIAALVDAGLIEYDENAGVVLLIEYMSCQKKLNQRIVPADTATGINRNLATLRRKCNGILETWETERDNIPQLVEALENDNIIGYDDSGTNE